MINLLQGDCLELMKNIPDKSIDMILCDLPYGTTRCKWDSIIPFEPLWEQYNRIIKDNGAIVLFSQMPFTAVLVMSNLKMFRYEWIAEKSMATGFLNAKRMPLKCHENICVFYKKLPTYNAQMTKGKPYSITRRDIGEQYLHNFESIETKNEGTRCPRDILRDLWKPYCGGKMYHPTQKPVPLLEYLIKTYTNESATVLDNCMGSGSTGVACVNMNRNFIGIELDENYFKIADERIKDAKFRKLSGANQRYT